MAFQIKYSKKFQRIGVTATYRVDILSEAGGGVITPYKMGADPFQLKSLGSEKDEDKVVIGSEIAFEFVLNKHIGESDYDAIFESEYRDHIVKFYNDDTSTLLWQGYLQPENMYKSVFESNLHIYFSASDALKDLSDYEFLNGSAIVTGRLSGLEILKLCLTNLDQASQFQYNFKVKLGTKHTGQGVNDTALKDVTHDCRRFSKVENGKTTIDNCLTVIEKVLRPYSCQLFQYGGVYYIKNRHEAATIYYTYNWALAFQSKANSVDVVNIDTLKFKRDAEQSLLPSVKEIGIKLLNRNLGTELVPTINTFGAGTPWDFSGFPGGDVIDEAPNLHIVLDDGNEANDRDITLTSDFAINKVTANDYLKLRFKFRASNTQHSNIDSPKLIITVTKPDGTSSTWEEYIINSWRMYESPNDEVFFVTEDGDYNITITFEQSTAASAPYTEDVYLTDFSLTKIVAIEDTTYSDITFDTYFKAVSDVGKKVKEPFDFFFGDSPGTGDLAALVYGGNNTSEWDRATVDDNKPLLELYALSYLTNRKAYSKYLILTVKDAADIITPVNYITFGGDTFDIVSFDKSYRFSWVTLHLKQRLTGDVTMTFNEVPLTSIDGEKMTNDSLVVTGTESFPSAGIALSTGTGWGISITNNSANWNTAYTWVNTNGANAVTAYGWGNHASAGYAPTANPTFTGLITHSHATYGDIKIGHDTSGAYIEQDGNSTAYARLRLQSSLGGDATNYSQLLIDPYYGFVFTGIGTGNKDVGFGTYPWARITLPSQYAIGWEYNANAASRRWRIENDVLEFGDIAIMTQSSKVGAVDVKRIVISAAGEVTVNGNGIITGSLMVYSS